MKELVLFIATILFFSSCGKNLECTYLECMTCTYVVAGTEITTPLMCDMTAEEFDKMEETLQQNSMSAICTRHEKTEEFNGSQSESGKFEADLKSLWGETECVKK